MILPKDLKTGDVLHCRGNGIIARLIMWATKSKWSHTAVYIEVYGQPFIIEAQANGVNLKSYYEWLKKYGYYYEVSRNRHLTDHKLFALSIMALSGVKGYDFVSLLIRQPISLITGRWRKRKVEDDRFYCSEFAMYAHDVEKSYRMSPQNVYDYCMNSPEWEEID